MQVRPCGSVLEPDTARGYPRAINNLALQALVATYAANKSIVDEASARAAVTEVLD